MAKWEIKIKRTEYYELNVVVEAENLDEAVRKTEDAYNNEDYLFEKLAQNMEDAETQFYKMGAAEDGDNYNRIYLD